MRAKSGSTGGASKRYTRKTVPSKPRPTAKGSTASGKGYKNAGTPDRKLGYGGEKYPTQKQVAKKSSPGKKK